jgi:hypothetical protein
MDETGDCDIKQNTPDSKGQIHIFSHMWELDLKDKCIHDYKHDIYTHTHTCVCRSCL